MKSKKAVISIVTLFSIIAIFLFSCVSHVDVEAVGSFSTAHVADCAETRANGAYGGTCKVFARTVVTEASSGTMVVYGYQSGWAQYGTEVSSTDAVRGDIIQITPAGSTDSTAESLWSSSDKSKQLHTAIIITNKGSGNFDVIDSNFVASNLVYRHSLNPYTFAAGSIIKIWRVGTVSSTPTPTPTPPPSTGNFSIQYYNNEFLQGSVIYTESANDINKNWGSGSPGNGVNTDSFSARFTGTVYFDQGYYTFRYDADDGIKVIIDDTNCVVDNNGPGAVGDNNTQLSAGNHKVVVEYAERTGDARLQVTWTKTAAPTPTPTPATACQVFFDEDGWGYVWFKPTSTGYLDFQVTIDGTRCNNFLIFDDTGSIQGSQSDAAIYLGQGCNYKLLIGSNTLSLSSANIGFSQQVQIVNTRVQTSAAAVNLKVVSVGYNSNKLTWSGSYADGFKIFRSTSASGTYTLVKDTTENTFTDTGLTAGKRYYYKIKAYCTIWDEMLFSKNTPIVSSVPVPSSPRNLTVTSATNHRNKVSWMTVTGASGYKVLRSTSLNGTYTQVKDTTYNYFYNTCISDGNTYYYKVIAYRIVGINKIFGVMTQPVGLTHLKT